jgi:hypothetical protein
MREEDNLLSQMYLKEATQEEAARFEEEAYEEK